MPKQTQGQRLHDCYSCRLLRKDVDTRRLRRQKESTSTLVVKVILVAANSPTVQGPPVPTLC